MQDGRASQTDRLCVILKGIQVDFEKGLAITAGPFFIASFKTPQFGRLELDQTEAFRKWSASPDISTLEAPHDTIRSEPIKNRIYRYYEPDPGQNKRGRDRQWMLYDLRPPYHGGGHH